MKFLKLENPLTPNLDMSKDSIQLGTIWINPAKIISIQDNIENYECPGKSLVTVGNGTSVMFYYEQNLTADELNGFIK